MGKKNDFEWEQFYKSMDKKQVISYYKQQMNMERWFYVVIILVLFIAFAASVIQCDNLKAEQNEYINKEYLRTMVRDHCESNNMGQHIYTKLVSDTNSLLITCESGFINIYGGE